MKALALVLALASTAHADPDRERLVARKAALVAEIADIDRELSLLRGVASARFGTVESSSNFWLSLDLGADFVYGFYPTLGISFPLGPITLSPGLYLGSAYSDADLMWGWYLSLGYSKVLIK